MGKTSQEFWFEGANDLQSDLQTMKNALDAPGIIGLIYRNFASRKIGNAFLKAHKNYSAL